MKFLRFSADLQRFVKVKKKKRQPILLVCRLLSNEATRTPDPYVPNVVRYQLRYIPIAFEKWCHQESNRGHKDFQSFAYQLSYGTFFVCGCKDKEFFLYRKAF